MCTPSAAVGEIAASSVRSARCGENIKISAMGEISQPEDSVSIHTVLVSAANVADRAALPYLVTAGRRGL